MNEEALIRAAQRGDVDAFNRLVLEYQQMAYNAAYRVLGSEDRAMDATQDAFLRGFRALHQFRGGSFKTWLLRIVTNACYDAMRYTKRRPSVSWESFGELDEEANPIGLPRGGLALSEQLAQIRLQQGIARTHKETE